MNEATLHKHLIDGLTSQGCPAYKFPDPAMGIRKPFDVVVCVRGVFVAIEAKISKATELLPTTTMLSSSSFRGREHQLETLRRVWAAGGLGWIVVGAYQSEPPYAKECYVVDARRYELGTVVKLQELRDAPWETGVARLAWIKGEGWGLPLPRVPV